MRSIRSQDYAEEDVLDLTSVCHGGRDRLAEQWLQRQLEVFNVSDAIFTLRFLFLRSERPRCPDAADVNDDGRIALNDSIRLLLWLFFGGITLDDPGPFTCGADPTRDGLRRCVSEHGAVQ
jgi:hypothetical protein